MMVGELRRISTIPIHAPPPHWPISLLSSNGLDCSSPVDLTALNLYLPSDVDSDGECDGDVDGDGECDSPVDIFSCDEFRMFEFKVRRCSRGRSHDWTDCPYAHPGEKARRRDPRRFHYSGAACADYRKGNCKKGDCCEFAHGVFECWLHPARYRTQPCKDGTKCRRRVCFFAHTPEQLRLVPEQGTPVSPCSCYMSDAPSLALQDGGSPVSTPPLSPVTGGSLSRSLPSDSVKEMMVRLRGLRLGNVAPVGEPWGLNYGGRMGFPGSFSLPVTPSAAARGVNGGGKQIVVKEEGGGACDGPDVGWVSELVK